MCLKKVFDSGKSSSKVISNAKTRFIFTRFSEHKIISQKSSIFFVRFYPNFSILHFHEIFWSLEIEHKLHYSGNLKIQDFPP